MNNIYKVTFENGATYLVVASTGDEAGTKAMNQCSEELKSIECINNNGETVICDELPKNPEYKPFDKIIVRDNTWTEWTIDFYSHTDQDGYIIGTGGVAWSQVLPYNEENAKLIGTKYDKR